MDFDRTPADSREILKFISSVRTGREMLSAFLPLYTSGKVAIAPYPVKVLTKLRAVLGEGQPVGACFMNDGSRGTIYLDMDTPIGVLAPFLIHEIAHALDENVWLRRMKSDLQKLAVEAGAFDLQNRFMTELRNSFPEYQMFLETRYPNARVLVEKLSHAEISRLYGFKGC